MPECPRCDKDLPTDRGVKVHHAKIHGESIAGVETECAFCGTTFRARSDNYDANDRNYCSDKCLAKDRRDDLSAVCANCGVELDHAPYRIRQSERNFCSDACRGEWDAENRTGQNHWNWRGGKSTYDAVKKLLPGPSWETVRKRVRQRDRYTCQMCGAGGWFSDVKLDTHHIVPILCGGANDTENLMVLCTSCHRSAELFIRDRLNPVLIE